MRVVWILISLLATPWCDAHTFQPSNVTLALVSSQQYSISIDTDLIELAQAQLHLTGSADELVEQVRALTKIQLFRLLDAANQQLQQDIVLYFDAEPVKLKALFAPNVSQVAQLLSFEPNNTDYRVTFSGYGDKPVAVNQLALFFPEQLGAIKFQLTQPLRALLSSGEKSAPFELPVQAGVSELAKQIDNSLQYMYQGIVHIVPKGIDHMLFVLALFLLSNRFGVLLWQVSAFTLAHTVSLALAIFGLVSVPSVIVEPLIALSIIYVAVENIYSAKLSRWRILLVFGFGLLHGLGFASVLMDVGLPSGFWLSSLISFNIGVELGQLLVIALAYLLLAWARQKIWYRSYLMRPLSGLIALMGSYWLITRVLF
jgi:hypothetical protein